MPDEPEAGGLLALMLLTDARRAARTADDGTPVLLADQDRSRWDRALVAEGQALVRQCLRRGAPGPYQVQAAVNAVHSDAATAHDTDWGQLLALYDLLLAMTPTPGVALAAVEGLPLEDFHLFHATRAALLRRVGRQAEAAEAYARAAALAGDAAECRFLGGRRTQLPGDDVGRRSAGVEHLV
jgi:RNA polymerase sigma-70 factor (ECF subfamily)